MVGWRNTLDFLPVFPVNFVHTVKFLVCVKDMRVLRAGRKHEKTGLRCVRVGV